MTVEAPVPLSCAPVPGCQESRWPPTMTISLGRSRPGISAMTLLTSVAGRDAVLEGELDGDGAAFLKEAPDEEHVFATDLCLRVGGEGAGAEGEGRGVLAAVRSAYKEERGWIESGEAIEGFEEVAEGGFVADGFVIDEDDLAFELIFLGVDTSDGELLEMDDLAFDAAFGSGWAPAEGVDVERSGGGAR